LRIQTIGLDGGWRYRAQCQSRYQLRPLPPPGGPASNSGLRRKRRWGNRKRPVAAGRGSGGYTYDIDPGKATSSILIFRMKSQDPGIMMPELGRSLVHSEAVTMLEAWIDQME